MVRPLVEKVLFKAEMKSDQELIEDAKKGKRDPGLKNLKVDSDILDEKGNRKDVKLEKHYTVQKLQSVQKGEAVETDYIVVALATPVKEESGSNPAVNFTHTIKGWFTTKEIGADTYGKATRYEAIWKLNDGRQFSVQEGLFEASTDGKTPSGGSLTNKRDATSYYPPSWGQTYVKLPSWDFVNLTGHGYAGGKVDTKFTAHGTSGRVITNVRVGMD